MFNKIRRNFIIIALSSAFFILFITIFTINIVNYQNISISSDSLIQEIYHKPPLDNNISAPPKPGEIGDNSYFIVIDNNGTLFIDEMNFHVRVISRDEALNIAKNVKESKNQKGYYSYYRYNVIDNSYIFLDATSRFDAAKNFLLTSIFISLGALILFFLLIFFTSKLILKPVKESYEKQKEFITNASHQLKTPLTIISANNELLEISGTKNEFTSNIYDQVEKMNTIIKNLVNFSKMSENKNNEIKEINLSNLIKNIINNFQIVCQDINIKLTSEISENIFIKAHYESINQMILIIMDNARKYAKSYIHVLLKNNKHQIIFEEINDSYDTFDGDLDYFTERFFRSTNSMNNQEGSGIGLSLLKDLSEKNKIKLKIYGKDSIFHISLLFK